MRRASTFPYLATAALSCLLLSRPAAAQESRRTDVGVAKQLSRALTQIAERATPGYVRLDVSPAPIRPFTPRGMRRGPRAMWRMLQRGFEPTPRAVAGYLVSKDGLILTTDHRIAGAKTIKAQLADGRVLLAKVVGRDPVTDLALLRIPGKDLPALELGNSDRARTGGLAIGLGTTRRGQPAVRLGIINRRGARGNDPGDELTSDAFPRFTQQGALIDLDGKMIGLATGLVPSDDWGEVRMRPGCTIVPSNVIKTVIASLLEHGKVTRGYLGVSVQELSPDLAAALKLKNVIRGALVSDVADGSPAAKAGIRVGDVIVRVGDVDAVGSGVAWLTHKVWRTAPNTTCTIKVIRNGTLLELPVTIGSMTPSKPADPPAIGTLSANPADLGLTVAQLDGELAKRFGYDAKTKGVVVTKVEPNGTADLAGIRVGFLVTQINDCKVSDLAEYRTAMKTARREEHIALLARSSHDHQSTFILLELGESKPKPGS